MRKLTRRKFFQGASALAAAAAVGIPVYKGIREHGPVDIRLFFFSKDPIVIKGDLLANEVQDLFRVRVYHKDKVNLTAEMKLSEIQKVISMPRKKVRLEMTVMGNGNINKEKVNAISKNGTLSFLIGEEGSPVWLMLKDVKQVL